jgi:hypothetical protein
MVSLSETLLYRTKTGQPTGDLQIQMCDFPMKTLMQHLANDHSKKAFWINIYNAYFQIFRSTGIQKPDIFRKKLICLAGKKISLDDIEHGILRKNRIKWSFGYLPNPLASQLLKDLAVSTLDYRIHFALNCGAKSCPPIAFYSLGKIDDQLELATLSFLEAETDIFEEKGEIHVSRLFHWFRGDFRGINGMKQLLREKLGLETRNMKIRFKKYNWEDVLHNFTESNPAKNSITD